MAVAEALMRPEETLVSSKTAQLQAPTERNADQRDVRPFVRQYLSGGWAVVAVLEGTKAPDRKGWPDHPYRVESFGPRHNVGGKLGTRSDRRVDVDCDSPEAVALAARFLPRTASRFGRSTKPESHWLYRIAGDGPITTAKFNTRVDGMIVELRGDGTQTVLPGSVHPSGEAIDWSENGNPTTISYDELSAAVGKLATAALIAGRWDSLSGNRHELALALSGFLLRGGWTVEAIKSFYEAVLGHVRDDNPNHWYEAAESTSRRIDNGEAVKAEPELRALLDNAPVAAMKKWLGFDSVRATMNERLTDAGNVDRFVERHQDRLKYADGLGPLAYEDGRWQTGAEGKFYAMAKETARSWRTDPAADRAMRQWGVDSLSYNRTKAIMEGAKLDPRLRVRVDQLDAEPWLLNVRNGTLNLQDNGTGKPTFQRHNPEDFLTKMAPTDYDEAAECPNWLAAVEAAMPDPLEQDWLQRFLGYALTGHAYEKVLLLAYGEKDTGKTTIINVPRELLGPDYGSQVAEKTIARQRGDGGIPTDVARLRGVRYGVVSETNEGTALNIGRLKSWTGRNQQIARFMRQNDFEFRPTMKLVIETNHKPVVHEADEAFYGRVVALPFRYKIAEIIRDFDERLKAEYPGILNWLIAGCMKWQKDGLEPPESLKRETEQYKTENSPVQDFFDERLIFGPTDKPIRKSKVLDAYNDWARGVGLSHPLGRNRLYQLVEQHGAISGLGNGNVKVFWNVEVNHAAEPPVWRDPALAGLTRPSAGAP